MITAQVSVSFEAASADEATAIVAGWTMPPGSAVLITTTSVIAQGQVDDEGNVTPTEPAPEPVPDAPPAA